MADSVDNKFVKGEPDIERAVRIEQQVLAFHMDEVRIFRHIEIELLAQQLEYTCPPPVGIGDEILALGKRMQAPPEFAQEIILCETETGRLARKALDDRQQIFGTVTDFAQQRTQKLLASPFRRHFPDGGFHHHLVHLIQS